MLTLYYSLLNVRLHDVLKNQYTLNIKNTWGNFLEVQRLGLKSTAVGPAQQLVGEPRTYKPRGVAKKKALFLKIADQNLGLQWAGTVKSETADSSLP